MPRLTVAAAVTGFLCVALGAFGAHGLEGKLTQEAKGWWETATLYGLVHGVAALSVSLTGRKTFAAAGWAFVLGAVFFSGSLYAMALGAPRALGMVTPLDGVLFLTGWALAGLAALRR